MASRAWDSFPGRIDSEESLRLGRLMFNLRRSRNRELCPRYSRAGHDQADKIQNSEKNSVLACHRLCKLINELDVQYIYGYIGRTEWSIISQSDFTDWLTYCYMA
jgi:hypothetical protein